MIAICVSRAKPVVSAVLMPCFPQPRTLGRAGSRCTPVVDEFGA